MDLIGKIVEDKNEKNPRLIIAQNGNNLRGIVLVKKDHYSNENVYNHLEVPKESIIKLETYKGRKLENRVFDCRSNVYVSGLRIREIGSLTENGYCMVLKRYNNYQNLLGADDESYLLVRNDIHKQLIKMMKSGIRGV